MHHKVLLVGINAKFIHTSLAIRSLKANAGRYSSGLELCEYTINHRKEEILARLYEHKPDAVGFSCYLWNIEYVLCLAADIKKLLPGITVFAGGPEVSYHPERFLRDHGCFDAFIVGEGEQTLQEYLEWMEECGELQMLSRIRGLVYRQPGPAGEEIVRTAAREGMRMDDLVFPYSELNDTKDRILYYESMRGCPFSCSYCLSSIEKSVRLKSLSKTLEELDFFLENRVMQVKFVDRTFNCNPDYAYAVWRYIGDHDNGITNFHFEIAGDLLREKDIELFRSFRQGLLQFEIGVQSTNQDTIRAIRRTMDLERLRKNILMVHAGRNIHQHLDLIAGLPYEDYDSFRCSFNEVYAMRPDNLQLGFLKLLDGSHMKETEDKYEMVYSDSAPYEIFSTKWLSYGEILQLKLVEEMLEVYYNSFQFCASMAYLEGFFESPFDLYHTLGQYYKGNALLEIRHNRQRRYEIIWEFWNESVCHTEEQTEELRELLTYDLFSRDYVKNPPSFVRPRTEDMKYEIRLLLDRETQSGGVLSEAYGGMTAKSLFHLIYIDLFVIDMGMLIETGILSKGSPHYLLFDYKRRSPLDHSAAVSCLSVPDAEGK